jgi:hypothetical protein
MLSTLSDAGESVRVARLRAAAPRYVAIAVLAVLLLLGLRALLWPPHPHSEPPPTQADLPSRSFALQFARAYLTYDANRPAQRLRALAAFVPANLDRAAGVFPQSGRQRVLWAEIASDQPALTGGWVLTGAAGVSTPAVRVYLAVPVRHPATRPVSLAGYPSFVGAPLVDTESRAQSYEEVSTDAISEVVTRVLRNYLAGSTANLRADLTDDAVVTLPTVSLRLERLDQLVWLGGAGSGAVLATVTANDTNGVSYTLTYEVGVVQGERPYVSFIEVIPTGS